MREELCITKRCSKCKAVKKKEAFGIRHLKTGDFVRSQCKQCESQYSVGYWRNPETKPRRQKVYSEWQKTLSGRYSSYKRNAKVRGIFFGLSFTEFCGLISQPCFYCGKLPETFNGTDRIDSKKDYTLENCIPCCGVCNQMKMSRSQEEFIDKCELVIEKQKVMSYKGIMYSMYS